MTQTTDAALVEALRARSDTDAKYGWRSRAEEYTQAADTIEAQARRIEALEGAVATIIRRCESLEDEAADGLSKEMGDHAHGWYRGQKDAAKSLRRHLHDLTRPTP